ncbi:MAG: pilin [Patescibacteria group bacterium]|nr:pilin [Patescibacteria group bacterium]
MKKGLGFILGTGSALLATVAVFAQTKIELSPPKGAQTSVPLEKIPQFVITLLFVVGIVIALAFLIYGGIKWIISGGDKANVDAARKHIVAAIIGLVIVVSAFVILNFVFQILFGSGFDLNNLCIPSLANPNCK